MRDRDSKKMMGDMTDATAHESGEACLRHEERRKDIYFGMFHPNMERLEENHGDRNKEGNHKIEMKRGYE